MDVPTFQLSSLPIFHFFRQTKKATPAIITLAPLDSRLSEFLF
jgi:hypothetical protein